MEIVISPASGCIEIRFQSPSGIFESTFEIKLEMLLTASSETSTFLCAYCNRLGNISSSKVEMVGFSSVNAKKYLVEKKVSLSAIWCATNAPDHPPCFGALPRSGPGNDFAMVKNSVTEFKYFSIKA